MTKTIAGIGEFIWDLFPEGKEPGGAVANVIQHAHAMGERAILVSRVGDDPLGREFFGFWKTRGLDASHITIDPDHPTGTVHITTHRNGDATYKPIPKIASDYIPFTTELNALARKTDAVCFGSFGQWEEASRHTLQKFLEITQPHCIKLYDINIRPNRSSPQIILSSLERATVLKLNDDELAVLATLLGLTGNVRGQLRSILQKFDLDWIALTRGVKGSLLLAKSGKCHDHPGIPVKVVDTVGAGDAFTAALMVGLLHQMAADQLNEFANRCGSYVCTQKGATPTLPAEILGLLS